MLVTELGMVTLVRPEQSSNALLPMLVTELGMMVLLHPAINVFDAVSMMALQLSRESYEELPDATVRLVKLEQPLNAPLPMLVTEFPMVTLVRPEHS